MRTTLLLVLCALLAASQIAVAGSNKATLGGWAENGRTAIRVTRVETARTWSDLGRLIRFGVNEQRLVVPVQKALESGAYKFVVLTVEMRNDAKTMIPLGWYLGSDARGYLLLRGEEGTEVHTEASTSTSIAQKSSMSWVTRYLAGGLPERADLAPKAVVKGRLALLVPDWFEPSVLFTRPSSDGHWYGKSDLIVRLK